MTEDTSVTFQQLTDIEADSPTLIEGLPGHGLVASIAVDQITEQLGLQYHGNIQSTEFPPVTTFEDGRVREPVRVYAGSEPPMMTLQSDVAIQPNAFDALGRCVIETLTDEFDRAIFLAGAPAQSEEEHGDVVGVATTDDVEVALDAADIELAHGSGMVAGVTGSLVHDCYQADIPTALLVVQANPYLPDPNAARSVIENALEPLVDFDIDTTKLAKQGEKIQQRKQQIAEQLQQMYQQQQPQDQRTPSQPSMYQ
ncbi:proteasome assembly chaperone family protein [Halomicrococcus sp. NG-SE-24]|uniref:proteasome assembly chaperone family protein n=1 Tax=Halomicrococcus sp. NG-SE-24 TaxID=3436928 RepID=UPI003D971F74